MLEDVAPGLCANADAVMLDGEVTTWAAYFTQNPKFACVAEAQSLRVCKYVLMQQCKLAKKDAG